MQIKIIRQCWVDGKSRKIGTVMTVSNSLGGQLLGAGQAVVDEGEPKSKDKDKPKTPTSTDIAE